MSRGPGTPSRDFTSVVLCSSRMMSMQSSTHSSQIKTVGPAMSFLTSCWLLPQNEQYSVFFESPPLDLVIATPSSAVTPARRPRPVFSRLNGRAQEPRLLARPCHGRQRYAPHCRGVYGLAAD